jgi:glycosyltransferase 2 family protein
MAIQPKKILVLILKFVVTAVLIYLVFRKINLHDFLQVLKSSNFFLLAFAVLFFTVSKVISSVRLNLFLRSIGVFLSEKFNMRLYWLGMYYNLFLPGGIGGDGYKVYLLNREFKASTKKLITTLLVDRVTGIMALFFLLIILGYFVAIPVQFKYFIWILIPLCFWISSWIVKRFFPDFAEVFRNTNLLSFGVQVAQLIATLFILIAMHQYSQIPEYLFVFLVSSIVAVIPFTIGGIGAREVTFLTGAQLLHLNVQVSVAVSMVFFAITALVSLWGIRYSFSKLKLQTSANEHE